MKVRFSKEEWWPVYCIDDSIYADDEYAVEMTEEELAMLKNADDVFEKAQVWLQKKIMETHGQDI